MYVGRTWQCTWQFFYTFFLNFAAGALVCQSSDGVTCRSLSIKPMTPLACSTGHFQLIRNLPPLHTFFSIPFLEFRTVV